jgi:hypothetical protein
VNLLGHTEAAPCFSSRVFGGEPLPEEIRGQMIEMELDLLVQLVALAVPVDEGSNDGADSM